MTTIQTVAEWIITHRRGKAFAAYSFEKIVEQLNYCCDNLSMLCVHDGDNIVGVVCCQRDDKDKVVRVDDILTIKPGVVKRMMEYFIHNYPDYTIEGFDRNGRYRVFNNPVKLHNRL